MKTLNIVAILITISLVSAYGFTKSGIFNVAAITVDGPVLTWLFHTTMENSVEKRARDIEVPDLNNKDMILAGLSDYAGMCAQCHAEPGQRLSTIAQGLNPAPPDLKHLAEAGTAAEKFWIIQNGIRMTGMPAFGVTHDPDSIWPVVAFLESAKGITTVSYIGLKKDSSGFGHHAEDTANEEQYAQGSHGHGTITSNNEDVHDDSSNELSSTMNETVAYGHNSEEVTSEVHNDEGEHGHEVQAQATESGNETTGHDHSTHAH